MATKKKKTSKKTSATTRKSNVTKANSSKSTEPTPLTREEQEEIEARRNDPDSARNLIILFALITMSILSFVFLFFTKLSAGFSGNTGPIGYAFCCLCFGLLGPTAYLIPFALLYIVISRSRSLRQETAMIKPIAVAILLLLIAAGFQIAVQGSAQPAQLGIGTLWNDGIARRGGGVVGGLLGGLLYLMLKKVSWCILIPFIIADLLLIAEITPSMIAICSHKLMKDFRTYLANRPRKEEEEETVTVPVREKPTPAPKKAKEKTVVIEEPVDDPEPKPEPKPVEPVRPTEEEEDALLVNPKTGEVIEPIYSEKKTSEHSLSDIYTDPPYDEAVDRLDKLQSKQALLRQTEVHSADVDLTDRAPWEEDEEDDAEVEPLTPEEEAIAEQLLNTEREPIAEETLPDYAQEKRHLHRFINSRRSLCSLKT